MLDKLETDRLKEFWSQATPMAFIREKKSYKEKRKFRYGLQDYMHRVFEFGNFAGKKVLDIGCGSGIDSVEFAKHGAIVTAVDFTDTAVESTKALFKEAGFKGKVMKADALDLPFSDNCFDCLYSYGVLHHIPNVESALEEMKRVLKPNGQVMAMLYHRDSLLYGFSIVYQRGIAEKHLGELTQAELLARYSERMEGNPYTKVYTKDEAVELFSKYFRDCIVSVHYNVIDLPYERKVKVDVPDKYELGWHLVIKGIK